MARYPTSQAVLTDSITSFPSSTLYTPKPKYGIFTPLCNRTVPCNDFPKGKSPFHIYVEKS
jgi:hypothetical protein